MHVLVTYRLVIVHLGQNCSISKHYTLLSLYSIFLPFHQHSCLVFFLFNRTQASHYQRLVVHSVSSPAGTIFPHYLPSIMHTTPFPSLKISLQHFPRYQIFVNCTRQAGVFTWHVRCTNTALIYLCNTFRYLGVAISTWGKGSFRWV